MIVANRAPRALRGFLRRRADPKPGSLRRKHIRCAHAARIGTERERRVRGQRRAGGQWLWCKLTNPTQVPITFISIVILFLSGCCLLLLLLLLLLSMNNQINKLTDEWMNSTLLSPHPRSAPSRGHPRTGCTALSPNPEPSARWTRRCTRTSPGAMSSRLLREIAHLRRRLPAEMFNISLT